MVQQTPQSSTWWSWSQRWASKGINIKYEIRDNRNGYKSGALKEGMKRSYVKSCDYVAIFDADFQPDFLRRTIPFLVHNPDLALVQTRWKFDAARECGGLPLGIVTLAESLKGVHELHKWKITLKRLKESNFWEMEDQILRLSNDCSDDATKQCFVYCALFDESQKIERWELIESFIEEGIIKEFDKGHSILDSLENVCLLERIDDGYDA